MAKRFGGEFSPEGAEVKAEAPRPGAAKNAFDGRSPDRRGTTIFLTLAALPLLVTAFGAGAVGMAVDLISFGLLMASIFMLREGQKAEAAYAARAVARRPALPRKMISAILMGLGIAGAAWDGSIAAPILFGVIAGALHLTAFGLDPMRDKGMEGADRLDTRRVARMVDEAETHLEKMSAAIETTKDRRLIGRVERFQATARAMFRRVEEDPRDLVAARKFLGVYLMGARDATIKFADLWRRNPDPQARADYETLLQDLEANFAAKSETLLLDDRTDLTVEIDGY